VFLFDAFDLATSESTFRFMARLDVIVVSSVAISAAYLLMKRRRKSGAQSNYGTVDRALHRMAFSAPFVQQTAADIEEGMFGRLIDSVPDRPPIFITALPRAGTTVLLNALHELPGVATHLYRDMPFVMAPLFWSRFSGGFRQRAEPKERAHRDGILVGYDSPEAFEEVLWLRFWPQKYREDGIDLWTAADFDPEATACFRRHFRKIVALRRAGVGRYVSKNNANIARLELIPMAFPGATIIVPLRDPVEHAASLQRQHENFLGQHARDSFVKRYMADIGHFEFGELHRPICFDGFSRMTAGLTPGEPDYWLAYWIAAYRYVQAHRESVHLLPQEGLADAGSRNLPELCRRIGLDPAGVDLARHFRTVPGRAEPSCYAPALVAEARALYWDLMDTSGDRQ